MVFNTSKWFYNTTGLLGIALSSIACNADQLNAYGRTRHPNGR